MLLKNYLFTLLLTLFVFTMLMQPCKSLGASENTTEPAVITTVNNPLSESETHQKTAPETSSGLTLLQLIQKGGVVGGLIIILSCVALALVVDYALTIRRSRLAPPRDAALLNKLIRDRKFEELHKLGRPDSSFLSQVVVAGLNEIELGYSAMVKAMEDTSEALSARMARKIEHLNVIGNIAPMLGLLGTVIGMLRCFNEISQVTGTIEPKQLAGGIFEALVTTCMGLIVAIPALYFFALFRNRVDEFVGEAALRAEELLAPLKKETHRE